MPRTCTVCTHPDRTPIDAALVTRGAAFRVVAREYGLSPDAVARHRSAHLIAPLAEAAAVETRQALDVLVQLKAINGATLAVLAQARATGDGDLVLRAVDRVQRQVELQAKLLGELDERPQINILVHPEWLAARSEVVAALAPYPEARLAVVTRLSALRGA